MTTDDLLQQLRRQDVRIWADGDRLRVNAPPSVLTPGLKVELAARKLEIREVLEARSGRRSSIVPIQPSGSRPAFYGIASVGDGFSWVQLARQLGPDYPFYAFEAPGIDGAEPPVTSIEVLAARYLEDLRRFQPDGPYLIGGFCVGGMVAFELARQLRAQGQEVALVALIESPSPIGLRFEHRPAMQFRRRRAEIFERARTLSCQSWNERLVYVRTSLGRVIHRDDLAGRDDPARGLPNELKDRVFWATVRAAYAYAREERRYSGRIVLFQGSRELQRRRAYLRQADWAQVAGGGLEIKVGIDGCTDYRMMLSDPAHVHALAELLKPYLEAGG